MSGRRSKRLALPVSVCENGHWSLGSIEPGIECGTCGGEYHNDTLVLLREVLVALRAVPDENDKCHYYRAAANFIEREFIDG